MKTKDINSSKSKEEDLLGILSKLDDIGCSEKTGKAIAITKDLVKEKELLLNAKKEWEKPKHEVFKEKNMWSFYNACTEALKLSPPKEILTRHVKLHNELAVA